MLKNSIADRVRQRREQLAMTRSDLAGFAQVSVATIRNIERSRNVSIDILSRVASSLNATVADLVGAINDD